MLIQGVLPRGLSSEQHFSAPIFCKVLPSRIYSFNQCDLLFAPPVFDLFFTPDGNLHVLVAFVVDQTMALVFLGKALNRVVLMLMNALIEKAGDSNIKCAGPAGKNVDPELVMETVAHAERLAHTVWENTSHRHSKERIL